MPTLNWIGKESVVNHHLEVPFRLLKDVPELSCNDPGCGNLILEGDNLVALKALLPYYQEKVKCMYIDPPYNTGNEGWVYNDNVNSPTIKKWLGEIVGKDGETLDRHDRWLCMMYPRLCLLRDFLSRDGVILISIDDFEACHLRCSLDEIFGAQNFIAQLVWDKTRKNDAKLFSTGHEYMLVYAKSLQRLKDLQTVWREQQPGAAKVVEEWKNLKKKYGENVGLIQKDLREWYKRLDKKDPAKKLSRYKWVDSNGPWRDRDISWPGGGGPRYDVIHPVTKLPCVIPERGWGFSQPEEMQRQINTGLVQFRDDHTQPPFRKRHLLPVGEETEPNGSEDDDDNFEEAGLLVMPSIILKQAQVSVKLLRKIFNGKQVFSNPKDHETLARLIRYVTKPGDIILDSFAGSGSTAHAVLQINQQDEKPRKFILIEMQKEIAEKITSERVRKAISGVADIPPLGGGFRYVRLGEKLFDENGRINEADVRFADLARHVYFSETGEPLPKERISAKSPLLAIHHGRAVYLLYNGILKDKSVDGGNVLTNTSIKHLPAHDGPKVVYVAGCRFSKARLESENITFKQTPYSIRTS